MILDQLFEDDKKKKLNEVDPRNFDSDEDYYAAVRHSKRGSYDDDYDYEPEDDIDDMDDDESYYEKYVRTKNLEGYETTPFGSVNDQRPQMPAVPQQDREAQEQARERQARISDFREKKRDLLQQFAQLGTLRTEMIHGLDNDVFLNKDQLIDFFEQQIDDPSLTALEYAYENNIPTDGLIRNILRRATQLGVSMLDVRKMFNQAKQKLGENIGRKVDAKGLTQGEWMQAVKQKFPDAKIVQAKMIDGPAHALLSDGRKIVWNPVQGVAEGYDTAEDYRAKAEWLRRELHLSPDEAWERAYDTDPDSWVGTPWEHDYKQGVAEVGQNFRRGNARRAALNAMSPEELKAHEEKRAEQQRKRDETRLERERQRNAAKKGVAEGRQRKLNEAMLMEDPVYRDFKRVGRYIVEYKMSEKQILDVFAQAEAGMTDKATGANRTMLGRGKDTTMDFAGGVANALKGVWSGIQQSVPVAAVDVAYDQATDALAGLTGGQKGAVMQAIKKYRNLAKQYPKTAGLAKGALVAITGLATGGAGLPAVAALVYGLDSAIKGEKLSDIALKAGGAAATAWAGQKIASALGGEPSGEVSAGDSLAPGEEIVSPGAAPGPAAPGAEGFGGGTYTVQAGDQGGYIAQANGISFPDLQGLNPQITDWNKLPVGAELQLPPANTHTGSVWDGSVTGTPTVTPTDVAPAATPTVAPTAASASPYGAVRGPMGLDYTTIAGIPVVPGQPLNATQMAVADFAMQQGNKLSPVVQAAYDLAKRGAVRESIKFKTIPANELIDQKLTVLSWALLESVGRKGNNIVLTSKGVHTVFENVDRYRKAIMEKTDAPKVPGSSRPEYYRPDMPGGPGKKSKPGLIGRGLNWLDKAAGKVGGALSNFGHQFTTNVTKEKLKMNWHQAGKPSDSDQLAAWLVTQGVPQQVVTDVFGKMGIPYTAPAAAEPAAEPAAAKPAAAKAQQPWGIAAINPETGKQWTPSELKARYAQTTSDVAKAAASQDLTNVMVKPGAIDPDALDAAKQALGNKVGAGYTNKTADMAKAAAGQDLVGKMLPQATTSVSPTATPSKPATPATASTFPGEDPKGPNYVGRLEVKRRQAARAAGQTAAPAKAPNFAQQGGYAQVNQPTAVKYSGMPAAKPAAPAGTRVTAGGPTPAERAALDKRIAAAAKAQPVAETVRQVKRMMETATSKADVQRIKDYIDCHMGTDLTESARLKRNRLISEVTQLAATRRRAIARQMVQ